MRTKYGAKRTYSQLCDRIFDSKAEAIRGEKLRMLELAGEIQDLKYQVKYILCTKPKKRTITIDFVYIQDEELIHEDTKGVLTRDFETKLLWLENTFGIKVNLVRG